MKGRERATYTIQKYDKVCWSCHKNGTFGALFPPKTGEDGMKNGMDMKTRNQF